MSVQVICGVEKVNPTPLSPYADIVCDFLDSFSLELRIDKEAKTYADVQTFAFWIRKANLQKKKEEFANRDQGRKRIGRGLLFHIAPSNVPVNCMFTYVFGLLAGNANVVRIPSKEFPQVVCMCRVMSKVLNRNEFSTIRGMTSIVRYERDKEITDNYSDACDMRIIWGGDDTINNIRMSALPPRSTEITFADRYSIGIISADAWDKTNDSDRRRIVEGFYNDTYLMDQNACSAPHLLCWMRDGGSEIKMQATKKSFWDYVSEVAKKYDLADIKVSEKYAILCEQVMTDSNIQTVRKYENLLYVCTLDMLPKDIVSCCRGKFGLFYEYTIENFTELDALNDDKVQTCAYYGINADELREIIIDRGFLGIDRIVPFGSTLDIDSVWDGYDLIAKMSRIIV